jgi:hypothetical protein
VGRAAKDKIQRIVERFGHDQFDFILLVYDGSLYDEACFAGCTIIHDKSPLFWQLKSQLAPELCRRYEYVFVWMDDLDVLDFDPRNFLRIMREYRIEVAQPSLSLDSVRSHQIVLHLDGSVGRYTDFVEQMALVFRGEAWGRFWALIQSDANPWGWGYDEFAYSFCGFRRMAVIDAEVIRHTHAGSYHETAMVDYRGMRAHFRRFHFSRKRTLCVISGEPWHKHVVVPVRLLLYRVFVMLYASRPVFFFRRVIRDRVGSLRTMASTRKESGSSGTEEDSGDKSHQPRRA